MSSAGDVFQPVKLWSLWDMQRFYGDRFSKVWNTLAVMQERLGSTPKLTGVDMKHPVFRNSIKATLDTMETEFRELGLTSCLHQIERIRTNLMWLGASYQGTPIDVTPQSVAETFNQLGFRLTDELKGRYMLALSQDDATLYECSVPLLGTEVADVFPSIAYDMDEAAKCFALDRSTACVFHLMRCMEAGLSALAGKLNVPANENWNKALNDFDLALEALQAQLNDNSSKKPHDWKEMEQFYSEASALLRNVKNAWRNKVMHMEKKYTLDEASRILIATKACMEFLAVHLSEASPSAS
jgi:hypothetical protein